MKMGLNALTCVRELNLCTQVQLLTAYIFRIYARSTTRENLYLLWKFIGHERAANLLLRVYYILRSPHELYLQSYVGMCESFSTFRDSFSPAAFYVIKYTPVRIPIPASFALKTFLLCLVFPRIQQSFLALHRMLEISVG